MHLNAHLRFPSSDVYFDIVVGWGNKISYPYLIKIDDKLAGFVLISDYPEVPEETTDYCLSVVFQILDKHHGRWQLKCHPHNLASVHFWNSVVNEYTICC